MKPPCALDRRTFLKELSVVAAGCAALPMGADAWMTQSAATVWKRTPCHLCGVGCSLLVAIQNGRAVAVKGDPDAAVNRGLACVKGYHSVQSLYGRDRITRALVRRGGALSEVPIAEALDLVARQLRDSISKHGPDSIAIYGSDWTITDEYLAARLFQRGLHSSNLGSDPDVSIASARAGLESSFGLAGAIGCYDDIEQADVFVIWNQNVAESDPVLFSRLLERRRTNPAVKIVALATRSTRTSYAADRSLLYNPQSELAIANALGQEIVARGLQDRDFIDRHVAFKRGRTGAGDGLTGAAVAASDEPKDAAFSDYAKFIADYTPERAQQLSGLPAEEIRWLASLYGDPARKVMSLWGAGVNGHTRGTWLNNLIYNIHLLVGKVAEPGNSPFPLASQPLSEASPARAATTPQPRSALSIFRALESGAVRFLWLQGANPLAELPNLRRYRKAAAADDRFIVVSAAYPSATTEAADVVLPSALWIERAGVSANAERRLQQFERMLAPPGSALSYAAQLSEIARRVGQGSLLPPADQSGAALWEEIRRTQSRPAERLPTLAELRAGPGVIWPVVNSRETRRRYHTASDPAANRAHGDFDFYGHPDHRAWIWLRPYEAPPESPDREYPYWLTIGEVLEHSATGALTRRIPTLHNAVPHGYVEINRQDALKLGIRNGEIVQLVSRRGLLRVEARIDYRAQPVRGHVFVPNFDDQVAVNLLTLDAICPLSGQPAGTCAVRIERLPGRAAP